MRVNIDIDACFRADEIRRLGLAMKYQALREKHRKAILDDLDRSLPDYERPTKKIPRTYKGISIRKIIIGLLP